jgi:AraC-like DNA-binding protein
MRLNNRDINTYARSAAPAASTHASLRTDTIDDRRRRHPSPRTSRRESVALEHGAVSRLRRAPQTSLRIPADLAGASTTCIHVLYMLAGAVDIAQDGHRNAARAGDIVAFDGALPAKLTMSGRARHDVLLLSIPAARFLALRRSERPFHSLRLVHSGVASPLSGCLGLIADHMQTAAKDELGALVDACASLLATAERRFEASEASEPVSAADTPLLRSILDYTNANISHDGLAPPDVAQRFGISVRYLHKLFAASGVTFGSYVAMRRLDHVRSELISGTGEPQSIAALALKWGFRDLSTFNKAFRKRFGCAPRRLRSRSAS